MMSVAITGNIAAGKTLVAEIWRRAGVPVVLADELAREAVAPGSEGLRAVVEAFGDQFLASDGTLDRGALRERVFADPRERERLEAILHPRIGELREGWMRQRREEGATLAVAEIPLLFEVGMEKEFDAVVLVEASREERLRRLVEDRGLAEGDARAMMEAQMPSGDKRSRSDFVLENGGTRDDLEDRALALLDLLRARARKDGGASVLGKEGRP